MQTRHVLFFLWMCIGFVHPAFDLSPRALAAEQATPDVKGNWGLGRKLFHSGTLGCFKCHTLNGSENVTGLDLSQQRTRDYEVVLKAIVEPTKCELPKESIGSLRETQLADLMAYLMKDPPRMPLDSPLESPALRTQAEVQRVLAGSQSPANESRKLNLVLVAGVKDHGPGEHDYPAWQIQWAQLLSAAENVEVSLAWNFPEQQQLETADVLVFFQKGAWNDQRQKQMDQYFDRGGGAVYIHWAVNGDQRASDFSQRIGLASRAGGIRYRHGPLTLEIHNTEHPIVRNFEQIQLYDESYWELFGQPTDITLLATSEEDGKPTPQMWTYERGQGKVFVSIPGHYSWTFDDPLFRVLLLRGIAWTASEPVDRFNELVSLGARIKR